MAHEYCSLIGKQKFESRREALLAAQNTKRRGKGCPSVYFCDVCKSWHLTHYSYEQSKAVRTKFDWSEEPAKKKQKKHKPMKIIVNNAYVPNGTTVVLHNLDDGGQQLRIILFDEDNHTIDARYTYDQALELIEAVKIQLSYMNPQPTKKK